MLVGSEVQVWRKDWKNESGEQQGYIVQYNTKRKEPGREGTLVHSEGVQHRSCTFCILITLRDIT